MHSAEPSGNNPSIPETELCYQLIARIRAADRSGAARLLLDWAAVQGSGRLLSDVLEPTLHLIGREWRESNSFSLAQAYVAAKVAEDALTSIAGLSHEQEPAASSKGPVILGNIEDDFHALGRRMVGTFLRARGWMVHDLGNDVPAAQFVDKAVRHGARVIGVSAMMLSTARNIRRLRDELDQRGLTGSIQLAVGGAVFLVYPDLVAEVGGDGTSANALGAAGLFENLWAKSCAREATA